MRGQNFLIGRKKLKSYKGKYPWLIKKKLHSFWKNKDCQLAYLVWLFSKLKIKKLSDCYIKLNLKSLRKYGFGTHQNLTSPLKISQMMFRNEDIKPWLFLKNPQGLFDNRKTIKDYFLWLFKKNKIRTIKDIYKIDTVLLGKNSGRSLCDIPNNYYKTTNFRQIIIKTFPEKNLVEWQFSNIRRGFWNKKSNLILLSKYIKRKHKFKKFDDWYKLNNEILINDGSFNLLKFYPNAISFLKKIYPNKNWLPWKFHKVTGVLWASKKFQKQYIDYFSKIKKINKPQDWYNIERSNLIKERGGYGLLKKLKTVLKIAKVDYPNYDFLPWKFKKIERGYFNEKKNIFKYLHWLEDELNINKKRDWYEFGYENFAENYGHSLLDKFSHSPLKILQYCYPKYPWSVEKFGKTSKFEIQLLKIVKRILKSHQVIHRYRSKKFCFKRSKRPMELDIYLPEFKTGIEFQGSQHFFAKWGKHELSEIRSRDREKKRLFKKFGIKVLYVTYKWKGQKMPIIHLLKKNRIINNRISSRTL